MDNPTGIVQAVLTDTDGRRAIVEVDAGVVCPRCAAGKGCGAGLLVNAGQAPRVEATVSADSVLRAGDRVELVLASDKLLRAALIGYGLPLLGALVAASIAGLLALGDLAAALAASAGLAFGVIVGRRWLRRGTCMQDFVPMVRHRLSSGTAGR